MNGNYQSSFHNVVVTDELQQNYFFYNDYILQNMFVLLDYLPDDRKNDQKSDLLSEIMIYEEKDRMKTQRMRYSSQESSSLVSLYRHC